MFRNYAPWLFFFRSAALQKRVSLIRTSGVLEIEFLSPTTSSTHRGLSRDHGIFFSSLYFILELEAELDGLDELDELDGLDEIDELDDTSGSV